MRNWSDYTPMEVNEMRDSLVPKGNITKTKVAIMGFSKSRRLAPFYEPEWEIWGLNQLYKYIPRWDRWFELHKRQTNLEDEGPIHIWELAGLECPIYMQQHYDDIPTSVAYPLFPVLAHFRQYMTSSFSYMAALAIMEGFKEIGVYGCDTADEEWGSQRPSLEYLLGYAEGKGIKVTIPKESSLLRAPFMYGYQEQSDHEFLGHLQNHERYYEDKRKDAEDKQHEYALKAARYEGAKDALHDLYKEWRLPFTNEGLPPDEIVTAA